MKPIDRRGFIKKFIKYIVLQKAASFYFQPDYFCFAQTFYTQNRIFMHTK